MCIFSFLENVVSVLSVSYSVSSIVTGSAVSVSSLLRLITLFYIKCQEVKRFFFFYKKVSPVPPNKRRRYHNNDKK